MLSYIKRIIQRMIEFAKRWGPIFFTMFGTGIVAIASAIAFLKDYRASVIILLSIFTGVCAILSGIALFYDIKDARKEDYKKKHPPGFQVG